MSRKKRELTEEELIEANMKLVQKHGGAQAPCTCGVHGTTVKFGEMSSLGQMAVFNATGGRMKVHQVQQLHETGVKFSWPLVDDGVKTSTWHESDWVLLTDLDSVIGVFPDRVRADQARAAFQVAEKAKLIVGYLEMIPDPTATEARTLEILREALR